MNQLPAPMASQLDTFPSWYWWFRNRIEYSVDLLEPCKKTISRWVDFGAGPGGMTSELAKALMAKGILLAESEIIGVEGDANLSETLKSKGIRPWIANLEQSNAGLPEDFDLFTVFDVLEHLENPNCFLDAIYRTASPNAVGIATVPAMQALWSEWDVAMHHQRRYDLKQLKSLLSDSGFRVLKSRTIFNWAFLPALIRKYRLKCMGQKKALEFPKVSRWINLLFLYLGRFEWRSRDLGLGTSLIALVSKN